MFGNAFVLPKYVRVASSAYGAPAGFPGAGFVLCAITALRSSWSARKGDASMTTAPDFASTAAIDASPTIERGMLASSATRAAGDVGATNAGFGHTIAT